MGAFSRSLLAVCAACASAPAWASAPSLSLDLAVVSDYRFRGVSYSDRDPAVQGEVALKTETGGYVRLWGSSIAETAGGAELELDLVGGWLFELGDGLSLDVGATWYIYPGDSAANYVEPLVTLSYELGPATPRVGLAYIPRQGATRDGLGRKRDNLYSFVGLSVPVRGTPLTLDGQLGYERGAFDFARGGGKWDWQLGGTLDLERVSLGVAYVDAAVEGAPAEPGATDASVVGTIRLGL
jgi:uncharacterized protein (TIGR02001 family)